MGVLRRGALWGVERGPNDTDSQEHVMRLPRSAVSIVAFVGLLSFFGGASALVVSSHDQGPGTVSTRDVGWPDRAGEGVLVGWPD